MAKQQSKSIWVWASLLLMLGAFVVFVLFLDQELANTASSKQQPEKSSAPNKPIIDFYSILPERELEISIPEEDRAAIENPIINKQIVGKSILQVGSFQSEEEADSLKAQLAFLGLEANVKSALVKDTTWHRVQIGPFASETGLSRAINLLIENRVPYMRRSAP